MFSALIELTVEDQAYQVDLFRLYKACKQISIHTVFTSIVFSKPYKKVFEQLVAWEQPECMYRKLKNLENEAALDEHFEIKGLRRKLFTLAYVPFLLEVTSFVDPLPLLGEFDERRVSDTHDSLSSVIRSVAFKDQEVKRPEELYLLYYRLAKLSFLLSEKSSESYLDKIDMTALQKGKKLFTADLYVEFSYLKAYLSDDSKAGFNQLLLEASDLKFLNPRTLDYINLAKQAC